MQLQLSRPPKVFEIQSQVLHKISQTPVEAGDGAGKELLGSAIQELNEENAALERENLTLSAKPRGAGERIMYLEKEKLALEEAQRTLLRQVRVLEGQNFVSRDQTMLSTKAAEGDGEDDCDRLGSDLGKDLESTQAKVKVGGAQLEDGTYRVKDYPKGYTRRKELGV